MEPNDELKWSGTTSHANHSQSGGEEGTNIKTKCMQGQTSAAEQTCGMAHGYSPTRHHGQKTKETENIPCRRVSLGPLSSSIHTSKSDQCSDKAQEMDTQSRMEGMTPSK